MDENRYQGVARGRDLRERSWASAATLAPTAAAPAFAPVADFESTTAEALQGVRLFAALPEATLRRLASRAIRRTVRRRALLFRKGEPCRGLHVVLEGRIEIYSASPEGREQVLHRIGARQAVTELAVFDGGAYPASARAVVPTRVLFIPVDAVIELSREHPELLQTVIADLGRSIRRLTGLVEKLSLKGVRSRVATLLLEQAAAHDALAEGGTFRMDATQEAMAHALAVTRESVARALAGLRRDGVVEQRGARVRILVLDELVAIAEGDGVARAPRGPRRDAHRNERLGAYRIAVEGPCC